MKKISLAVLLLASLLTGCKKVDFVIPDDPFTYLKMKDVIANNAWFEVIPANNDFYYLATYFPKEVYDVYKEAWVDTIDKLARNLYREMTIDEPNPTPFEEACLDKGAFEEPVCNLIGGTDYVAFGFPYNQDGTPVHKVTTYSFTTPPQPVSQLKFTLSVTGSIAKVTPSNNDTFFWYFDDKETVDKEFGYPSYYFSELIDYFWEYGFLIPENLPRGPQEDDISNYFDLKVGDTFYFMMAGYDYGMSTELSTYEVTYNGPGKEADIKKYERKPLNASKQTVLNGIQRNLERRIHKSSEPHTLRR